MLSSALDAAGKSGDAVKLLQETVDKARRNLGVTYSTLAQALMKVGEAMYKAAAEQGGAAPSGDGAGGAQAGGDGAGAQGGDDKVVDADFEEVDERKGKSA